MGDGSGDHVEVGPALDGQDEMIEASLLHCPHSMPLPEVNQQQQVEGKVNERGERCEKSYDTRRIPSFPRNER